MELNDKVITLEQALRLRELGVFQDSGASTCWYLAKEAEPIIIPFVWIKEKPHTAEVVLAFDTAELGIMLPADSQLYIRRNKSNIWSVTYANYITPVHAQTEAIARCNALIQLIEKGYVRVCEINYRLTGLEFSEETMLTGLS